MTMGGWGGDRVSLGCWQVEADKRTDALANRACVLFVLRGTTNRSTKDSSFNKRTGGAGSSRDPGGFSCAIQKKKRSNHCKHGRAAVEAADDCSDDDGESERAGKRLIRFISQIITPNCSASLMTKPCRASSAKVAAYVALLFPR